MYILGGTVRWIFTSVCAMRPSPRSGGSPPSFLRPLRWTPPPKATTCLLYCFLISFSCSRPSFLPEFCKLAPLSIWTMCWDPLVTLSMDSWAMSQCLIRWPWGGRAAVCIPEEAYTCVIRCCNPGTRDENYLGCFREGKNHAAMHNLLQVSFWTWQIWL